MKQTGIKLVFSKDFYKAMLIYSAILPEAISLHISILILTNKKRYNRFNEKFYKVSGKMQYILIYIIHKYFFWNFILRETLFYTIYNRRESIKYGDCITQEKDITILPWWQKEVSGNIFYFFYSANFWEICFSSYITPWIPSSLEITRKWSAGGRWFQFFSDQSADFLQYGGRSRCRCHCLPVYRCTE